jgi:hypothetical protein
VPQDPVIFSGSVRSNLDPFDQAGGDAAIWQALRQAGIDGLVKSLGVSCQIHMFRFVLGEVDVQQTCRCSGRMALWLGQVTWGVLR